MKPRPTPLLLDIRVLAASILLLAGFACTVDTFEAINKKGVWPCNDSADCVDGYRCLDNFCQIDKIKDCFDRDKDEVFAGTECSGDPSTLDCDDNDPNNFPGNPELCDGQDNNCNDEADEGIPTLPCPKTKGVCGTANATYACVNGIQTADQCEVGCTTSKGSTDCPYGLDFVTIEDGLNRTVHPHCDDLDNDCDDTMDENCVACESGATCGLPQTGLCGHPSNPVPCPCIVSGATIDCSTDEAICKDGNGNIVPGAFDLEEVPGNADDEDCDGQVD